MTENIFEQFAKGKQKENQQTANCVVYTRVSTKEQADNNLSLDTQRKACELYALKQGLTILGDFGGTYESAQTDERKEFNAMLTFVKKCREKISFILVYSVDRFSRSGANAIWIKENLRKQGVMIVSVTQQADSSTSSGNLQQNIQFIFSEYDNNLRREKCMAGTREALLRGEWVTMPPLGFDMIRVNGKRKIVVNDKGKLIRKAFYWKADEGMSNQDIRARLESLGLKLNHQRISEIFRNPFYCGLLVHTSLEGQVVEGNQEKIVSKEVFLKVNGLLDQNTHGYKIVEDNAHIPLKRFIQCDNCGKFMRGYLVRKKNLYYYKCNTIGCNNNKNAKVLHAEFTDILQSFSFTLNPELATLIKTQMVATYHQLTEDDTETKISLQSRLQEVTKKLNRIEERYMDEEFSRDLYIKYTEKHLQEKRTIEQALEQFGQQGVSNLDECIEKAITISSNLASYWTSANYTQKQQLQFLVFPEGIRYNKEKDKCRTTRINSVFSYIAHLTQGFSQQKSGIPQLNVEYAALVARRGVEPLFSG